MALRKITNIYTKIQKHKFKTTKIKFCYLPASNQNNYDIIQRPDFLKEIVIGDHTSSSRCNLNFLHVTWTFVVYRMSRDQSLFQICLKSNNPRRSYWWLSTFWPALRHAVTLACTSPWTFFISAGVTYDNSVPNLSEIEQFSAELLITW